MAFRLDAYGECRDSERTSFANLSAWLIANPGYVISETPFIHASKKGSRLMQMKSYSQKEIETASREEILAIQN